MRMPNPPHPSEIIREFCMNPLNLTVTKAAEALGVVRKTLSTLLNGRAGISPEMALRLLKFLGERRKAIFDCNFNLIYGKQNNPLISAS